MLTVSHIWVVISDIRVMANKYCIAGNFRGRKLSQISRFFGYSQKFSPRNLEAWCPLAWHEWAIHGSFVRKNHIFHQFVRSFLPGKFLAIWYINLFQDDQWTSQRVRLYYLCVTVRNWSGWMRGWFLQAQSLNTFIGFCYGWEASFWQSWTAIKC